MPIDPDDLSGVTVIKTAATVSVPADNLSAADVAAIRGDIAALQARDLAATPGVDLAGIADGQTLIYDSGSGEMVAGTPDTSIQIWRDSGGATYVGPANRLDFEGGLRADDVGGALRKKVTIVFAGTGSASTAARSDHSHTGTGVVRQSFAASGNLSSGTRTLVTKSVTLAAGIDYVLTARVRGRVRGGGAGSSYYTERVTINGNTWTSEPLQCVSGVPADLQGWHTLTLTGTGAAITFSAALGYDSGDPTYVGAGELIIHAWPNR